MHKSPIEIIYRQMRTQIENDVIKAVQDVGVNVDRNELIRALKYDRDQYEKGYQDAISDRDLVAVVHGRWIRKQIGKYTGVDEVCCSICGNFEGVVASDTGFSAAIEGMNYCPNCGADMRDRDDI